MTKGKVDALLGIVFGDEGKGKVVDYFTPRYDVVARFAGGCNEGMQSGKNRQSCRRRTEA